MNFNDVPSRYLFHGGQQLPFTRKVIAAHYNDRDSARAVLQSCFKLNGIDIQSWMSKSPCPEHRLITESVRTILKDNPDMPVLCFFKHQENCDFCYYVGNLLIV